jgi:glycosyltransferase involved in cell wall biosynthesis
MIENKESLPLVSIVVPCYNHERYVKETIDSIVNQTYKNIELIVIDDGSKDNSVEVIKKLADKYNFTFIHRPNKGLSATLNEGIKLSKGKYFCACASDDIYMLDKIEKQVEFMEANPEYGMCYTNVKITDGKKTVEHTRKKIGELTFENLLFNNQIFALSVMIKKDVFNTVGLYDESLYIEDWDMWLRIANAGYKIGFIEDYLGIYRKHDTNISSNFEKMEIASEQILNKWKSHTLYQKALTSEFLNRFKYYSAENKQRALKYLFIALTNISDKRSLKGIIKLLLPSFIINLIRKYRNTL